MFDAITVRIRRFVRAEDLDAQWGWGKYSVPHLPDPVPQSVKGVAIGQMVPSAGFCVLILAELVKRLAEIALHPTARGLIVATLLVVVVCMAVFYIPGRVVRAGFRIVRRDARGVESLYTFAMILTACSALATLGLVLKRPGAVAGLTTFAAYSRSLIAATSGLAFNLWSMVTLRRYQRDLDEQLPVSQKR